MINGKICANVETNVEAQCQTCMMDMFPYHRGHWGDRKSAPPLRTDKVSGIYIAVESQTKE